MPVPPQPLLRFARLLLLLPPAASVILVLLGLPTKGHFEVSSQPGEGGRPDRSQVSWLQLINQGDSFCSEAQMSEKGVSVP